VNSFKAYALPFAIAVKEMIAEGKARLRSIGGA